jgi:hypothetical protein
MIDQEILYLQRGLLLEKLKDIDKQMGSVSLRPKKGYTLRFLNGKFLSNILIPKQENISLSKGALIRLTGLKPIREPLSIEKPSLMTIL